MTVQDLAVLIEEYTEWAQKNPADNVNLIWAESTARYSELLGFSRWLAKHRQSENGT